MPGSEKLTGSAVSECCRKCKRPMYNEWRAVERQMPESVVVATQMRYTSPM